MLNSTEHKIPSQSSFMSASHPASQDSMLNTPGVVASPPKALHNVMQREISGRLVIRSVSEESTAWTVYVGKGQLHFVNSTVGERERLDYILQRTRSNLLGQVAVEFEGSAYLFLYRAWKTGQITLNQLRTFVRLFSQEALVHVLSMPQAVIQFDRTIGLDPILMTMPLRDLISPIAGQIGTWQQLRPHITSPLQRIGIADQRRFDKELSPKLDLLTSQHSHLSFSNILEDQPCIYQLASRLNADVLQVATLLAKGVESQILAAISYGRTEVRQPKATIVCIDDSVTVQRNVKLILEAAGYRVLGLTNPLQALSSLAKEKPALILMDISMPNLDGYELCRLLRQSAMLKHMPIVMLTGRDGFIDKVRAKVAGSTDYITKPFEAKTLMDTVAKYVQLEEIRA